MITAETTHRVTCDQCQRPAPRSRSPAGARTFALLEGYQTVKRRNGAAVLKLDLCPTCRQAEQAAEDARDQALPVEHPRGRSVLFKV